MDDSTPGRSGQPDSSRGRRRRGRGRGKGNAEQQPSSAAPSGNSARQPGPPARRQGPPYQQRGRAQQPARGRGAGASQRGAGPSQRGAARPPRAPSGQGPGSESPRSTPRGQLPDNLVYGINAVAVALDLEQIKVLYYDQSRLSERAQQIHAQASAAGIEIRPLQRQGFARALPAELHQGVAGMLHEPSRPHVEEIVAQAKEDSCILVLDRVQDPQNLGAVLRTAAASGVDAVVLPKAGGCPITPAVHKASAGMSLVVPVVEDENLARVLDYLKEHGYWVIGCDSAEGEDATAFEFPRKRVIVMGNEAEGMRRLVRENCDYLVRIPMAPGVESLNISVATAVVLYLAIADLARADWEEQESGATTEPADA